ncbi:MAG TPA: HAD-IIA family hydrolase [Streptosporangiaceae bacterium]|nr:HAD-IIA family hydrolase [Streptosporangiaceae bacterium]
MASDRKTNRPPISTGYDVALLDLDGVVYTGHGAVPGAVPALAAARAAGMRLAFVTNNASRTPSAVAAHLTRLGVPATSDDVVTSAQAAATLIASKVPPGSAVLVAGATGLRMALRARGLRPVSVAADKPAAVVQGFNPEIGYGQLAEAAIAVRNGALFVASNADLTIPSPRGLQPGNGSMIQVIVSATGVAPEVAGKPEPPLHREAVERTGAKRPLVVGDRLDTDIEGAFRGGADSLLVLTGVSTPRETVLAPPSQRPTYISGDLSGLLQDQPVISELPGSTSERSWGGWTASRPSPGDPIELAGYGDPVDGLRALCALAWSAGQVNAEIAGPALKVLETSF